MTDRKKPFPMSANIRSGKKVERKVLYKGMFLLKHTSHMYGKRFPHNLLVGLCLRADTVTHTWKLLSSVQAKAQLKLSLNEG